MLPLAVVHAAPTHVDDEPAAATLEVRTILEAQVDIDGATYEGAPVEVEVPAGEHRIEVTAPGYHPWRATVRLGSGSHITMTTDLLSSEPALLASTPGDGMLLSTSGAAVFLGSQTTAEASPLLPSPPRAKGDVFMTTFPVSSDVFLAEPAATGANPFMPSRDGRPQDVFMSKTWTKVPPPLPPMATIDPVPTQPEPEPVSSAEFMPTRASAPAVFMPAKRARVPPAVFLTERVAAEPSAPAPAVLLPANDAEAAPGVFMRNREPSPPSPLLPTSGSSGADVFMPTQ